MYIKRDGIGLLSKTLKLSNPSGTCWTLICDLSTMNNINGTINAGQEIMSKEKIGFVDAGCGEVLHTSESMPAIEAFNVTTAGSAQ